MNKINDFFFFTSKTQILYNLFSSIKKNEYNKDFFPPIFEKIYKEILCIMHLKMG